MKVSGQFQALAVETNPNYPLSWRVVGAEPVLDISSKKFLAHARN
jgi:hypothetical protein